MMAVGRTGGRAVGIAAVLLTAVPPVRLAAQDTSFIDRGVRVGIIYRPGVRPGFVLLPRQGSGRNLDPSIKRRNRSRFR